MLSLGHLGIIATSSFLTILVTAMLAYQDGSSQRADAVLRGEATLESQNIRKSYNSRSAKGVGYRQSVARPVAQPSSRPLLQRTSQPSLQPSLQPSQQPKAVLRQIKLDRSHLIRQKVQPKETAVQRRPFAG